MSVGQGDLPREERFWQQGVGESLPALIWSTDRHLRLVGCRAHPLNDLPQAAALPGMTLFELFKTDRTDFPPIAAHCKALAGHGGPIEFVLTGREFCGHVAPLCSQGERIGCVAALVNAPQTDVRLDAILKAADTLTLFLQPDGTIQELNRPPRGSSREQVIGKTVFDFVPEDSHDLLRATLDSVLRTAEVRTLEVRFRGPLGQRDTWQSMRIGPVQQHGAISGLVLLATNITTHKDTVRKLEAEESLLRDLLELQDRERRMVACEIHDGFTQDIIGARMLFQGIRESLRGIDSAIEMRFDGAVRLLGRAVNESRRLINELRPMIIDETGIVDAIKFLVSEEELQSGIRIEFTHRVESDHLPAMLQSSIFRMAREALANARRHAEATQIKIRLTQIGQDHLILEIQDNGIGFDVKSVPRDRYGIEGICERARLFGGGATIESEPGMGTRITVKVALNPHTKNHSGTPPDWTWTT